MLQTGQLTSCGHLLLIAAGRGNSRSRHRANLTSGEGAHIPKKVPPLHTITLGIGVSNYKITQPSKSGIYVYSTDAPVCHLLS